jgi:hypothetical protein
MLPVISEGASMAPIGSAFGAQDGNGGALVA